MLLCNKTLNWMILVFSIQTRIGKCLWEETWNNVEETSPRDEWPNDSEFKGTMELAKKRLHSTSNCEDWRDTAHGVTVTLPSIIRERSSDATATLQSVS